MGKYSCRVISEHEGVENKPSEVPYLQIDTRCDLHKCKEREHREALVLIEEAAVVNEMDRLYHAAELECRWIFCGSSWSEDRQKKAVSLNSEDF